MRYKLRTLLIVMTLGPPLLAMSWFASGQIKLWLVVVGVVVSLSTSLAVFFAAAFAVVASGIWIATTLGERIVRFLDR
jgi:hypothetical protein